MHALRLHDTTTGFDLDLGGLGHSRDAFAAYAGRIDSAFAEMRELEAGAIANGDENRRVGHYWLRAPRLAPDGLGGEIRGVVERALSFARGVREGTVFPPRGGRYESLLLIGIGGSALGPQLVIDALAEEGAGLAFACLDNTDPDGMRRVLRRLDLTRTLFVVTSKSGGTKETRNGMLEARAACAGAGVSFARQAVAVTGEGSALDRLARDGDWLARFPMWDWVGGRTSVTSAAGLLPAALCGVDAGAFLDGARVMDERTRRAELFANPAALLAVGWHLACSGDGSKDMVVLPYRDRLLLLGPYLQQLVMESLGKDTDRSGRAVAQGLTVYGNKGSTDQHAYVQQLRDGVDNFFVTFVRVLDDGDVSGIEVEPGITSGDYLHGFWLGTRRALADKGRAHLTVTVPRVDAFCLGALIALFERTVGLYASLVDVNAYHQPGVEAGKRAAEEALRLRGRILETLGREPMNLDALVARLGGADAETCRLLLEHLAANSDRTGVRSAERGWSRDVPPGP